MQPARLGIGTASFIPAYGLPVSAGTELLTADLIAEAVARGIDYIDTAAAYGEAEHALGRLSALLRDRRVRICTKVAYAPGPDAAARLAADVDQSRRRLAVDCIDTVLLHSVGAGVLRDPDVARALDRVKSAGHCRQAGASTYGADDAAAALASEWCNALQIEYSVLNQSVMTAAAGARRAGQEIVARSVLCKGLLTSRNRVLAGDLPPAVASAIAALHELAGQWGYTLPELAIRFALDTPGIQIVLVGVVDAGELDTACRAAARPPLAKEQWRRLAEFDRSAFDAVHPQRWSAPRVH